MGTVDDLLALARQAGAQRDFSEQYRWSVEAMRVSRVLVARQPDDRQPLGLLARGLYHHAYRALQDGRTSVAQDALTEAARHYTALVAAEPEVYAVEACDVRLREALVWYAREDFVAAARVAEEAAAVYEAVSHGDPIARDLGVLRAYAMAGRAWLYEGHPAEAMAAFDEVLFVLEGWLENEEVEPDDLDWFAAAPADFRRSAPELLGAAVAGAELHDAAGELSLANAAAAIAAQIVRGLASTGNESAARRAEPILARAQEISSRLEQAALAEGLTPTLFTGGLAAVRGPWRPVDVEWIIGSAGWRESVIE
ncbi:hypothetical protein [Cryptosporangium minutisporangium]|uniref:Tetratricopeptide repeat protein n=1 Tax=Cryptosporangium minutisporangium TaxID=113569 RepID=A0ABP6SZ97_9ACTN